MQWTALGAAADADSVCQIEASRLALTGKGESSNEHYELQAS
jgi:hypothetical protein